MFIRILGLWCAWHTFLIVIRLFFACCGAFIATMQRISLAENSPPDCFHLPVRLALAFKSCQPLACINRIEGGQNDLPLFYVKDEQKRCVLQKICIELNLHILIVPWKNFSNDRDSILLFLLYMNLNTMSSETSKHVSLFSVFYGLQSSIFLRLQTFQLLQTWRF